MHLHTTTTDGNVTFTAALRKRWPIVSFSLAVWFIVGWIGSSYLSAQWRALEADRLRSSLQAAADLIRGDEWQAPWESDPKWAKFEERLGADLVPQAAELSSGTDSQGGQTSNTVWSRSATGPWRVTVSVPIPSAASPMRQLRGTRSIGTSQVDRTWWICWATLGMIAAALSQFTARKQERHDESWQTVFEPWRKLLQSPPPASSASLPLPQELDHIAAPAMLDISRTVNAWLDELQQTTARNDLVLGNLNEGLLAVDEAGRVLLINSALRGQFQITQDSCLLRPYVEAVRIPRVVQLIDGILKDRTARDETVDFGTPKKHFRLLGSPLPLGADRSGVILTVLDNTLLQQSELARRDFIAGASHELKTPLAAIRAYAETLETAIVDDPASAPRFLSSILQQADRMNHLVTSMLQLARAESGAIEFRKEAVDVTAALKPCLDATDGIARSKGVELEVRLPVSRLLALGDYDAFQTIAGNLLSNAVRYTGQGGRVTVEAALEEGRVVLRVSDTGIGIAEEDRDRIFERFYRAQKDRAAESGGTGLGLAIVKQLVAGMGGDIRVDSRLGRGACFEVRLPTVGFT